MPFLLQRIYNSIPHFSKKQKILLFILFVFLAMTSIPMIRVGNDALEHESYYASLELDPNKYSQYSKQDVKKAYRKLHLRFFPDKVPNEDAEKMRKLYDKWREAFEVLTDDELREVYDLSLNKDFGAGQVAGYLAVKDKKEAREKMKKKDDGDDEAEQ
jgi:preprotein translocase subunit Sec63